MYSLYLFQVSIPERKTKTKDPNKAPEFVYNVMGTYIFFAEPELYLQPGYIIYNYLSMFCKEW